MRLSFLGIPHTARHTKFSIKEPRVKESVHVLFDETNSLVENDAQIEDFELGLAKKDLLPKEGKNPEKGSGPGAASSETGQGLDQTGGSTCLEQN